MRVCPHSKTLPVEAPRLEKPGVCVIFHPDTWCLPEPKQKKLHPDAGVWKQYLNYKASHHNSLLMLSPNKHRA